MRKAIKTLLIFLSILFLSSCKFSSERYLYKKALKDYKEKKYISAKNKLTDVFNKNSKYEFLAASYLAEIYRYHLKNYKKAFYFYNHVIYQAPSFLERKKAMLQKAEFSFKMGLYERAIFSYEVLLSLPSSLKEEITYKTHLAKAYAFGSKNMTQSIFYLNSLLERKLQKEDRFNVLFLKSNLFLSSGDCKSSIKTLSLIEKDFKEDFKKKNLILNQILCLKEMKNYSLALDKINQAKKSYQDQKFLSSLERQVKDEQKNSY